MNLSTFVVASVIVIVFLAIVISDWRKKKSGKGGCSCGGSCSSCGAGCHCGEE